MVLPLAYREAQRLVSIREVVPAIAKQYATHPVNARLGTVTNAPQTYMLDGKQHVLVAAGDQLYAFRLN